MRSFKNLKDDHQAYVEDGERPLRMKLFNNVVKPSILEENDDTLVIENIPLPELHLYLNHVTNIATKLTSNIQIKKWFEDTGIFFHGYNGGGLDGPNCRKLITKVAELQSFLISHQLHEYFVLTDLLIDFANVADACFGMNLNSNYKEIIENFIVKKHSVIGEIKE